MSELQPSHFNPHHNPPEDDIYDITFIGAGPTGLFGSFYAGMRQMSCKIIDVMPQIGGQLTALYPEKWVYDAPGYPKILAKDLAKRLWEQANHWNPKVCLNEQVQALKLSDISDPMVLETEKGVHLTRTLVITAGQGAMAPTELQNEGVNRFKNKGVLYHIKDKNRFHNKKLLIVGGGDSAFDWALNLKDYANSVILIHRSDKYKAEPVTVMEAEHSSINLLPFNELRRVDGENKVEKAVVFNNRTKMEITLDIDYVLLLLGFKPDLGPIKNWGLEFADAGQRQIKVNGRQETYLPGIYAAGDIARNPDVESLGLIATGFGQVPTAVGYAYVFIHPGASVRPGHSSNLKL